MEHKSRLGAIAAVCAVAAFFTFANCMVGELNEISPDYGAYENMENDVPRAEAEVNTQVPPESDMLYAEADPAAETEAETAEETEAAVTAEAETEDVTQAPESKPVIPSEISSAETEEELPETEPETERESEAHETDAPEVEIITEDMADDNAVTEREYESPLEESAPEGEDAVRVKPYADKANAEIITAVTTSVPETSFFQTEALTAYDIPNDVEYMPFAEDEVVVKSDPFEDVGYGFDYFPETTVPAETEAPEVTVPAVNYAETLTVRANGSTITLDAYTMVCKIVANEVSTRFNDEAIKAQAVAAYSYVKYNNIHGQYPDVLLANTVPDKIANCVSAVWGKTCYYNGEVALSCYSASSAGATASSVNVWGGARPYLVSVSCPFDAGNDPNYGLTMTMSESDVRYYLERYLGTSLTSSPENWLVVSSRIDGNYVGTVTVDNAYAVTGRQLRENVFGYKIRSASFDISYSNGYFTFTTYGYGHGVGMSQNGANILANMGYDYVQILKYYFTGITVA